jgi:hypothetical protein
MNSSLNKNNRKIAPVFGLENLEPGCQQIRKRSIVGENYKQHKKCSCWDTTRGEFSTFVFQNLSIVVPRITQTQKRNVSPKLRSTDRQV